MMHPSGADAYPVTKRLTAKFHEMRMDKPWASERGRQDFEDLVQGALDYVGEYEHGSVDIGDLIGYHTDSHKTDMEMLADVIFDFVEAVVVSKETS